MEHPIEYREDEFMAVTAEPAPRTFAEQKSEVFRAEARVGYARSVEAKVLELHRSISKAVQGADPDHPTGLLKALAAIEGFKLAPVHDAKSGVETAKAVEEGTIEFYKQAQEILEKLKELDRLLEEKPGYNLPQKDFMALGKHEVGMNDELVFKPYEASMAERIHVISGYMPKVLTKGQYDGELETVLGRIRNGTNKLLGMTHEIGLTLKRDFETPIYARTGHTVNLNDPADAESAFVRVGSRVSEAFAVVWGDLNAPVMTLLEPAVHNVRVEAERIMAAESQKLEALKDTLREQPLEADKGGRQ